MSARASWLALAAALAACNGPTEDLVHVDADAISKARARVLHVRVESQEGQQRLDKAGQLFGAPPEVTMPTIVPVVPENGDASRTFTIRAELLDKDDKAFNKKAAVLSFVPHELVDVDLYFSDLCIGIDCPDGETCSEGKCVDIHLPPIGPTGAQPGDAQPGACEDVLCWENPKPLGSASYGGVCLWAPDAGVVMNAGALVLEQGVWKQESVPAAGGTYGAACWPGGEVVAVGPPTGVFERRGGVWSKVALNAPGFVQSAWGASADDVWVVGDKGAVYRRTNHGAWQSVDIGAAGADLAAVAGASANDVFFGGRDAAMKTAVLIHFDGASFKPFPAPPGATFVRAIAEHAPNDLVVVDGSGPVGNGPLYRFDGATWTEAMIPDGAVSVATDASGFFVAGGGRGELAFREPGSTAWTPPPVPPPDIGAKLAGASVSFPAALLAGDGGEILHFDGKAWVDGLVQIGGGTLRGGATDPALATHAIAVGDGGLVLERLDQGVWRQRVVGQGPNVVKPNLADAAAVPGGFVAVGAKGAIAASPTGLAWSLVASPTSLDLARVASAGGVVLAVGQAGTMLERSADGAWAPAATPSPTTADLTSVAVAADGSAWIGAADGAVYHHGPNGAFAKIGASLPKAVTEIAIDPSGALWVAAQGAYRFEGGAFKLFAKPDIGAAVRLVVDASGPIWTADGNGLYARRPDGTFTLAGYAASAIATWPSGRVLAFGVGVAIRSSP